MATRTITQQGQSWGTNQTSIVAAIDGVEVFAGPVLTIHEPPPSSWPANIPNNMFSWTVDTGFQGSQIMTISVSGSLLCLADTLADYSSWSNVAVSQAIAYQQVIDGITCTDCLTNVTINGIPKVRGTSPTGQWFYQIYPGQTFQATVNILEVVNVPIWNANENYSANSVVLYNTATYRNGHSPAAAGLIPPDYPDLWIPQPVPFWQANQSYSMYARVQTDQNPSTIYKALQNVPAGIALDNVSFWQQIGS